MKVGLRDKSNIQPFKSPLFGLIHDGVGEINYGIFWYSILAVNERHLPIKFSTCDFSAPSLLSDIILLLNLGQIFGAIFIFPCAIFIFIFKWHIITS
jgi:hypothetical protein